MSVSEIGRSSKNMNYFAIALSKVINDVDGKLDSFIYFYKLYNSIDSDNELMILKEIINARSLDFDFKESYIRNCGISRCNVTSSLNILRVSFTEFIDYGIDSIFLLKMDNSDFEFLSSLGVKTLDEFRGLIEESADKEFLDNNQLKSIAERLGFKYTYEQSIRKFVIPEVIVNKKVIKSLSINENKDYKHKPENIKPNTRGRKKLSKAARKVAKPKPKSKDNPPCGMRRDASFTYRNKWVSGMLSEYLSRFEYKNWRKYASSGVDSTLVATYLSGTSMSIISKRFNLEPDDIMCNIIIYLAGFMRWLKKNDFNQFELYKLSTQYEYNMLSIFDIDWLEVGKIE